MKYKISIIIPFKNAIKFINQSLNNTSRLVKKFKNIEVIYIDDNSNDKSYKILSDKISKLQNFKLLKSNSKTKNGPGIARNVGLLNSRADFVIFLDIDDKLVLKNFYKLLTFIKNKLFNFIYLKKISESKSAPYKEYNSQNLKTFFSETNNMEVISILFRKSFLLKNKIFFLSNIYEDILYSFKCHFYNNIKIYFFSKAIYLKKKNSNSITNSKINLYQLKSKFNAWKSINKFLKKNVKSSVYKNLKTHLQYRFRGELANEYQRINNSKLLKKEKKSLIDFAIKLYKQLIDSKFIPFTIKDHIVKKILNN